ncbi:hypothetical protein I79_019558 [Cricetulus griseus]|uniref:Uncharacterized protein n=1 Tax=Cricetulus griseus TaxID=10029 RepID=G3I7R1_CRIGR|nr:hypothetical protein I79_019558 [Cricetulus griseus]
MGMQIEKEHTSRALFTSPVPTCSCTGDLIQPAPVSCPCIACSYSTLGGQTSSRQIY